MIITWSSVSPRLDLRGRRQLPAPPPQMDGGLSPLFSANLAISPDPAQDQRASALEGQVRSEFCGDIGQEPAERRSLGASVGA